MTSVEDFEQTSSPWALGSPEVALRPRKVWDPWPSANILHQYDTHFFLSSRFTICCIATCSMFTSQAQAFSMVDVKTTHWAVYVLSYPHLKPCHSSLSDDLVITIATL